MHKIKKWATIAVVCGPAMATRLLAQESGGTSVDLSGAEGAVDSIQTAVVGFFKNKIGPMVLAIAIGVFAITLIMIAIKWARRPTSGK